MKNKLSDLRNHMFAALERLGAEDLNEEDLKKEISRSQAISEVGKVIVDSAKTEVMYAKITRRKVDGPAGFLEVEETAAPEKVKGIYSNKSPLGIASGN